MGSSTSKSNDTNYIQQVKEIDENELDLNKVDTLQMKAMKEMIQKMEKIEERKSDKFIYKLPPIQICSYSLI